MNPWLSLPIWSFLLQPVKTTFHLSSVKLYIQRTSWHLFGGNTSTRGKLEPDSQEGNLVLICALGKHEWRGYFLLLPYSTLPKMLNSMQLWWFVLVLLDHCNNSTISPLEPNKNWQHSDAGELVSANSMAHLLLVCVLRSSLSESTLGVGKEEDEASGVLSWTTVLLFQKTLSPLWS